MKKIIFLIIIVNCSWLGFAQQDAMFTHYAFNTQAINPAYAGTRDALTITGLHRNQWATFKGAPVTQTLTLHTPVFNKNLGLGLSVLNDKIGPTNTSSFYLDISYKFKITAKSRLSLGLKGGLNIRKTDLTSLNIYDQTDYMFVDDLKSEFLPNFGFGAYYYTDKYYAGISIPKLFENNFEENTIETTANITGEQKHYFIIAGAVFKLSESIMLKPTTFVKVTNAAPIEWDFTGNFIFYDSFWVGAMYRTGDAFGVLAGLNVTPQFAVGYSFDWSMVNTTGRYNAGSHEIMLRYDLVFKEQKMIRSPRYF